MKTRRQPRATFACLLAGLSLVIAATGQAEVRTLTDQQGRTIKADVIAVENDTVKIKREDGRTFDLPLSQLGEADQKSLREWAKTQESVIPAGSIEAIFGRAKFKSTKLPIEEVKRSNTDGTEDVVGTIHRTNEDWGYTVTLVNRIAKPLKKVRIDYRLFVKPDKTPGGNAKAAPLTRQAGTEMISEIAPRSQAMFKTTTMRTLKTELRGDVRWGKTGGTGAVADSLYGIWVRIYVGDQLVNETCTPDSISTKETW